MTPYRDAVERVLQVLSLTSSTEFSWFGQRFGTLPAEAAAAMSPEDARRYLVYNLQQHLYMEFYCKGAPQMSSDVSPIATIGLDPFVQTLSHANAGSGSQEPGWTVVKEDEGKLVVTRGGLSLWVSADEVTTAESTVPSPGATVSVRMPKELLRLSPGFYMALGDAPLPLESAETIVRVYWNLESSGAAAFVAQSTALLNRARLPFRMKVVSHLERYTRCDAGVIYVLKRDYEELRALLPPLHRHVRSALKARIPAFAKELAPGVGLAEDPGNGDSFGMHRCSLVAEGVVRAGPSEATTLPARLDAIAERFREEGLSLDRPYLGARSIDDYEPLSD